MATSLSIKGKTQGNEAVTSTINYVNPNATNAQLVSLATAMNNLTTNTVADITRIDKNSLVNTIEKQNRNLQLSSSTLSAATISTTPDSPTEVTLSGADIDLTALQIQRSVMNSSSDYIYLDLAVNGDNSVICLFANSTAVGGNEYVFSLPEDSVYQAAAVTLTIS